MINDGLADSSSVMECVRMWSETERPCCFKSKPSLHGFLKLWQSMLAFITWCYTAGHPLAQEMWLRWGVVIVLQVLCEDREEKETERKGRAPAGRQAVQPLPALGFLSSLNMPVIFNPRRNRAQRRPPLLEYFLSVRRGNGGEPRFPVTWHSWERHVGGWGGEKRRGKGEGACLAAPSSRQPTNSVRTSFFVKF